MMWLVKRLSAALGMPDSLLEKSRIRQNRRMAAREIHRLPARLREDLGCNSRAEQQATIDHEN